MERIYHPVSGEKGYFATEQEKVLIDAVLIDFKTNQLVVASADSRGAGHE